MQKDKQDPTLFSVEELPKPRKSVKSSKSVAASALKVDDKMFKNQSLATRMRPRNLDEFVGQTHIVGHGQALRRDIETDCIDSFIFYGPPGTGKTTLAQIIANKSKSKFEQLNAVKARVDDIRGIVSDAINRLQSTGQTTILFIDEIHRFNTAQQDALLPDVESSVIKLIGATTENPFREVNPALVSRSQIFELRPLAEDDLLGLLRCALKDEERGLGHLKISADEDALRHLVLISDGDARKALNCLETAARTTPPEVDGVIHITLVAVEKSSQKKAIVYGEDAKKEAVSAFQKSMRGSDADSALYWLAKMIQAGEKPEYIARRIVVCAAEDVGLADPMALMIANAALESVEKIGWPEAKLHLAQAAIYISTAPKSNSATRAIEAAEEDVKKNRSIPFPKNLHDRHCRGLTGAGQCFDYKLPHDYPDHFVAQDYLGVDKVYYNPSDQGAEKLVKERVENWRRQFQLERANVKPTPAQISETPAKSTLYVCKNCDFGKSQNGSIACHHKTRIAENGGVPINVSPDFNCNFYQPAVG